MQQHHHHIFDHNIIWTLKDKLYPDIFASGNGNYYFSSLNTDERNLIEFIESIALNLSQLKFRNNRIKIQVSNFDNTLTNRADSFDLTISQGCKCYTCTVNQLEGDGIYEIWADEI